MSEIKFAKSHEWIKIEGDVAIVGITKHAADALGEIVYVELPEIGKNYKKSETFGVVESAKSASDVYLPIGGEIVEVNSQLSSNPEAINNSPFQNGWMVKIKNFSKSELDGYMNESEYNKFAEE